jgi:hypothetical protein
MSSGGRAIVAERRVGKGRCIYFGSTADREWTDLARTPMYVPLVRQLVAYLTDQLIDRPTVEASVVDKHHPQSGIAAVEGEPGRWLVTNVDPRESALDRITLEDLQKLAGGKSLTGSEDNVPNDRIKLPADSLRPDEIWTRVIWLLLAVLAVELLLASRVHA